MYLCKRAICKGAGLQKLKHRDMFSFLCNFYSFNLQSEEAKRKKNTLPYLLKKYHREMKKVHLNTELCLLYKDRKLG